MLCLKIPCRALHRVCSLRRCFSGGAGVVAGDDDSYDVVVVGGGVVGTALACKLAVTASLRQYRVALVEPSSPKPVVDVMPDVPDLRVYALSPASRDLLSSVGVWRDLEARAEPFSAMQVWDHHAAGHITFDAAECGVGMLGFVAEHNYLQSLLYARARELEAQHGAKTLRVMSPASVVSVASPPRGVAGGRDSEDPVEAGWAVVKLDDGAVLRSRLVVAADGGASPTRQRCGFGMYSVDYAQRALVCTVHCTGGVPGVAWQRFLANGPVAVLPLWDDYASVVWSTTPEEAAELAAAPVEIFNAALNAALAASPAAPEHPLGAAAASAVHGFATAASSIANRVEASLGSGGGGSAGDHGAEYREPPRVEVCSPRVSFPLRLAQATTFTKSRVALIGDAAHTIHPMAGQGLNLGLADATSLAETLDYAAGTGQDLGAPSTLESYDRSRRAVNMAMGVSLDALKRLFDAEAAPVAWARGTGLGALNTNRQLKRKLASVAMGL